LPQGRLGFAGGNGVNFFTMSDGTRSKIPLFTYAKQGYLRLA